MKKTRTELQPRDIAQRNVRSNVSTGQMHALRLDKCAFRLRWPLSRQVGYYLMAYPIQRTPHPSARRILLDRLWEERHQRHLFSVAEEVPRGKRFGKCPQYWSATFPPLRGDV